jgi:hypothetical protein
MPVKDAAKLDLYAAADINWLDEMTRVAAKLPPPTQARIEEFRANAQAKGGGNIVIKGGLDEPGRLAELEVALRDKEHVVSGSGSMPVSKLPNMPWRFEETIMILPPGKAAAIKSGPTKAGPPAAKNAPTKNAATKNAATKSSADQQGGQQ